MMRHTNAKLLFAAALTVGAVVGLVMVSAPMDAQGQFPPAPPEDDQPAEEPPAEQLPPLDEEQETEADMPGSQADLQVGTYDPQSVLEQHPAHEELWQAAQSTQSEMQKAQEQDDYEQVQQLQKQYQEKRNQILDDFEADIDNAIPEVAEDMGVQVVALEVVYTDDNIQTKDITSELVDELNDDQDQQGAEEEAPTGPEFQFE